MSASYYHSSTLGNIPLSFRGRQHMQNMRDETVKLLEMFKERYPNTAVPTGYWDSLSHARGRCAEYISSLEAEITRLKSRLAESETQAKKREEAQDYQHMSTGLSFIIPPISKEEPTLSHSDRVIIKAALDLFKKII